MQNERRQHALWSIRFVPWMGHRSMPLWGTQVAGPFVKVDELVRTTAIERGHILYCIGAMWPSWVWHVGGCVPLPSHAHRV